MNKILITMAFLSAALFGLTAPVVAQKSNTTTPPDSEYAFMPIKDLVPDTTDKRSSIGLDIMIGNNGFGAGFFYRQDLNGTLSWTLSLSGSEAKAPNEVTTYYYDYYGYPQETVIGKINQLFVIPAMVGLQYRLFKDEITNTFQPYINAGVGPDVVLALPYNVPLSSSLSNGHSYFGAGAYVGAGMYFGLTSNSVMGISVRYYILPMSKNYGIESLQDEPMANFNTFFITFNIATQY
ncbi:MAG: hypothetical protein WAO19_07605 [Candidatus Kryptoniota bacterium]